MYLLEEIKQNPFLLAPMAGITDCGFRSYMRDLGCGVVTTELVSAAGICFENARTLDLMKFTKNQHPVGIQIFGEDLEQLKKAASKCEEMGADFIDLNFGCPVPKVVKKGAGSAILKDLVALRDVLRATKSGVSIPVTIKVRTGWDHNSKNSVEVAQIAYDEGITWMAVHGRTRSQAYTGKADWEYIANVKAKAKLPIIGNGDLTSPEKSVAALKMSGCDAVMIGRGCLKNPWLFQESLSLLDGKSADVPRSFHLLFENLWSHLQTHASERILALQTKKLAAWYSAGYPESAQFRKDIFQFKELEELQTKVLDYFSNIEHLPQPDTSSEDFLMGGHG